jgi:hypothetical protein
MAVYTVVDKTYHVDLYRSQKSVCEAHGSQGLYLSPQRRHGERPATNLDIATALRASNIVFLYAVDKPDWQYRIEKQMLFL